MLGREAYEVLWSMVSTAADRSRRQRHNNFCDLMALMRWSWIYSRAVSVEWCLQKADWWGFRRLLEIRWSVSGHFTKSRSIILDMRERLEIGQ